MTSHFEGEGTNKSIRRKKTVIQAEVCGGKVDKKKNCKKRGGKSGGD